MNTLDASGYKKRPVYELSNQFQGCDPAGNEISFNNYYMKRNGKPYFGISGECHYSRVSENQWEDTILKMKIAGINIISTYVLWIHHEEIEGQFRFDGRRNLREFLQLCKKHGMYAILRIGPFAHGEVRNGGLPDWLYGKPFEVRSLDKGFLEYTKRYYHKVSEQIRGLCYKDGGPIIGTQLDNEYMHSAAPWEQTTGVTNEWIPGGSDGDQYMLALKKIAQEEGIVTPFYTCTGWGGAATPVEEFLPLWGGYAFWPWIYYNWSGEHPATPEYIYRDNHNNEVPKTYNFEPKYPPESIPYACCEMGGGMTCFYPYRFQLPYESVDAMANIKLASGCNFLGYYMFRGGTNPTGEKTPFLNEVQCPKLSYDYQAPIGEFGQIRPSYDRLRALHLFLKNFSNTLCDMITMLPEGSQQIQPEDVKTLRMAIRTDGHAGFLFLNNYQDHVQCQPKKDEKITLVLPTETLVIDHVSMKEGEEAILPFHMQLGGYELIYAKAQPFSVIQDQGKTVYFFFVPEGMDGEYCWSTNGIHGIDGAVVEEDRIYIRPEVKHMTTYTIHGAHGEVEIVTLTREQSLQFYELEEADKKTVLLSNAPITFENSRIHVEAAKPLGEIQIRVYPTDRQIIGSKFITETKNHSFWKEYRIAGSYLKTEKVPLEIRQVGAYRYVFEVPEGYEECKDELIQIEYQGDVAYAFTNGTMISDNFCNGSTWEIGLREVWSPTMGNEITLLITPLKKNSKVNVSSTMAGRVEENDAMTASLQSVTLQPVEEIVLTLR